MGRGHQVRNHDFFTDPESFGRIHPVKSYSNFFTKTQQIGEVFQIDSLNAPTCKALAVGL